jgi:hypothetical protein
MCELDFNHDKRPTKFKNPVRNRSTSPPTIVKNQGWVSAIVDVVDRSQNVMNPIFVRESKTLRAGTTKI